MKIGGVIYNRRQKFIKLMVDVVDGKDMIRVYKECFPKCQKDKSAISACLRLLTDVELVAAIDKLRQEKEEVLKKARQKEIERRARDQVATEVELDAVLSNIAMGQRLRKKKIIVFNPVEKKHQTVTVDVEPDETAMIAAADKLYKRKGSYAEKKIKHEAGDSFIEALKALSHRKNKQSTNV